MQQTHLPNTDLDAKKKPFIGLIGYLYRKRFIILECLALSQAPITSLYTLPWDDVLYWNEVVSTFADLSKRYNIPKSAFFQCLQTWHALNSITWPPKSQMD